MDYGNIPDSVLQTSVNVPEYERNEATLKQLIDETTDEPIVYAQWKLDKEYLESFIAWTENHVLQLLYGGWGWYLLKIERHPKK